MRNVFRKVNLKKKPPLPFKNPYHPSTFYSGKNQNNLIHIPS